jgi:hypothetical protein
VAVLPIQHVPQPLVGERVLAHDLRRQLGQDDGGGLVENGAELTGGPILGNDFHVGVRDLLASRAGSPPRELGIDVQHLQLALLEGIHMGRSRNLEAVQFADLHL